MVRAFGRPARGLFILLTVLAIALAACSGGSGSAAPTGGARASTGPGGGNGGNGGSSVLGGAAAKLSDIASYKFSMTLAGGDYGSMLSALGGAAATGNAPFTMTGTIIAKPDKAADITMGAFHIIEVGGNDYLDMSGSGSYISTPTTSSMADAFAPSSMFSSMISTSYTGFNKVGSEPKNGVGADHYQGTKAVLDQLASAAGVTGATWTADVWIASDGGYPVSMAIVAIAADKTIAYEILFDITNVNDPANQVTAPKV
jgi:hypothetical protein